MWSHFAQWLAENDHLREAAFVKSDFDMIRRALVAKWSDVTRIRDEAKLHGPFAVRIIDDLLPRIRRAQVDAKRRLVEPPPVPRVVKELEV